MIKKKNPYIARQYGSRCNIDSFLLNKKGLEELSILHKNFCNMHIARRNMHIATESILRLTRTQIINSTKKCKVALLRRKLLSKSTSTYLCFSYTLRVPTVAMGTLSVPYVILLFYLLVGQTLGQNSDPTFYLVVS